MTHGKINVHGDGVSYDLYATHDGHTRQLLLDLLELPLVIHRAAVRHADLRDRLRALPKGDRAWPDARLQPTPWYLGVLRESKRDDRERSVEGSGSSFGRGCRSSSTPPWSPPS